jgi:predicted nicotinamide N-methyase
MSESIEALHAEALDAELGRHFTTAMEEVTVGTTTYVLRKPENADHLISEADYVMDERLPYWADLWPSARVLAATVLAEQGNGRRLLELGCGLGLATVAAMDAGFDVLATDYYVDAIHMTRANAWRNLGREPSVQLVNWRVWPDDIGVFDVVMAADVLYEKEYAILVAQCIARALAPAGVAYVADPGRLALPDFHAQLPKSGLRIANVTRTRYEAGAIKQEIQVMQIVHMADGNDPS